MKTTSMKRNVLTPIALGVLLASASVMAEQTDVEKGWFVQGDVAQAKSYGQEAEEGVYRPPGTSSVRAGEGSSSRKQDC